MRTTDDQANMCRYYYCCWLLLLLLVFEFCFISFVYVFYEELLHSHSWNSTSQKLPSLGSRSLCSVSISYNGIRCGFHMCKDNRTISKWHGGFNHSIYRQFNEKHWVAFNSVLACIISHFFSVDFMSFEYIFFFSVRSKTVGCCHSF